MHCTRCGTLIPESARFCLGCGSPVDASQPTVAQAVASPNRLSDSGALELRNLLLEECRGDYDIHEEVGRGGMAVVYRATEIHLARQVAVKVLPPELTFGRGATERFRREAKTAAALDHPNIIPIYRIAPGGRLFWYAMKFLEGRSLADVLTEKGLLTVSESIAILEQVADALDYAHQRGVVHRDIKPGNVMLDQRGRVIVTDFGIAKELQQGAALTGSGNILGTPYYMSPEQCRGTELTGAADQYSLAVMAYQMISGQLPFEADSAIDLLHKHCIEPPPPIDSVLPGLPKHVINALNRGMAKKPNERFESIQAFVNALKGVDSNETTATIVMHKRPSLSQRLGVLAVAGSGGKGRTTRIAAGVGALALMGVVGALLLKGGSGTAANGGANRQIAVAPPALDSAKLAAPAPTPDTAAAPARTTTPPVTPQRQVSAPRTRTTPPPAAARDTGTRTPAVTPPASTARDTAKAATPPTAAPAPAPAPARPAARQGYLRVSISGGYAAIFVNGQRRTESSAFADSVPAGRVTVRIERPGFQTQSRTVTVRSGQEASAPFTMRAATP